MEKLDSTSMNITEENIEKLKQLFPNIVSDGKINFDILKEDLGEEIDESREKYQFTWNGKSKAIKIAQIPSSATLLPRIDKSKLFNETSNLYIEGDNLEVLKQLQKTYHSKVKIIYIDPPYNTGSDFVYADDFSSPIHNYIDQTKQQSSNPETDGRYHTNWLNMMFPRLILARNLLSNDGVIFISIGQTELNSLIEICNEVFGESNLCGIISRVMKSGGAKGRFFSPNIEYILVYAKNSSITESFKEPLSKEIINKLYTSIETAGTRKGERYRPFGLYQSSLDSRPNQRYFIECPDGELVIPPGETMPSTKTDAEMATPIKGDGCWRWSRDRYLLEKSNGNIAFKLSTNGVLLNSEGKPAKWNVYTKIWLSDREDEGMVPVDLITKWENRQSKKELEKLGIPFDFAKPVDLIKYLISLVGNTDTSMILDFFSGSATTAHAVMQLNAEDGGHRKFIMVQLPEKCEEDSEAYKAGYKTICDIGEERIRRAGEQIRKEWEEKHLSEGLFASNEQFPVDIGFKVFSLDSTNIKAWDNEHPMDEDAIMNFSEYVFKDGRSDEDVLYEIMLKYGVFDQPASAIMVNGKTMYRVGKRHMIVCLANKITDADVKAIGELHPRVVIFKEAGFGNDDNGKINAIYNLQKAGVEDVKSI